MNKNAKVMIVSSVVNILLSIMKLVFGFISKSQALIADGIHSFSDLSTDLIAIIGNGLSLRKPDLKHPYGHGKIEYLTSIIISLIILYLGISIIYKFSFSKISGFSMIVVIVSGVAMIVKTLLANYIIKKGKQYKNNILIASGNESKMDAISSIVVLLSAILMYLSKYSSILAYSDKIASIIVGIFIIKTGINILKENASTILGEQETDEEYINQIKGIITLNSSVCEIDELVLLKMGQCYKLICDLSMDANISILEAHNEIDEIEKRLDIFDEKIKYKTIHVNPYKMK